MVDKEDYAPHLELDEEDYEHMDCMASLGEEGLSALASGIASLIRDSETDSDGKRNVSVSGGSETNFTSGIRARLREIDPTLTDEEVEEWARAL